MEYATIPVAADPIECENLLRASDDEIIPNGSTTSSTSVHRYVHEHIHHHYHHFDENDEA